jgi:hypothetical protein
MHNLDSFLKHVTDDIAVGSNSNAAVEVTTVALAQASKKGSRTKTGSVNVVSSQDSQGAPQGKKDTVATAKVNGGVNFICADIDIANSLVSATSVPC